MSIRVSDLRKSFGNGKQEVLRGISLSIADGEFVSITGRSGSGKSTLLYVISSLDPPTSGFVEIDGVKINEMPTKDLHRFRNERMGFIFQFHYLLPELTALENILMPCRKTRAESSFHQRALDLLGDFGLESKADSLPRQLSGGEQQRVAIARALIMKPRYLFADEPTGDLDSVNGDVVMKILRKISSETGTTVIMVTHDLGYAAMADRQIILSDGQIVGAKTE